MVISRRIYWGRVSNTYADQYKVLSLGLKTFNLPMIILFCWYNKKLWCHWCQADFQVFKTVHVIANTKFLNTDRRAGPEAEIIMIIIIIAFKAQFDFFFFFFFFTISSLRRKPSPTRTLKWPGCNLVQIKCNTLSAYHVQLVYVPCCTKGQLSY